MSRTLTLLVLALVWNAPAEAQALRAGAARMEITDLAPPAQPGSGKYAHEHLFIRAIVADTGTTRAALIGADRADMDEPIWQLASKRIAAELDCPIENIRWRWCARSAASRPRSGGPQATGFKQLSNHR